MDSVKKQRAKEFISQTTQRTDRLSQETNSTLQSLTELFSQFTSVVKDLLQAKSKYISIVEKYVNENPQSTGLGNYFPGLTHKNAIKASIPQEEMQVDSSEMENLAELVEDLGTQKEALQDQIERTFKKAVNDIHQIESLSTQSSQYLDTLAEEFGEIYGNSKMHQLVQKNAL